MKINLAVWTAVNGYAWQPGHVYSPEDLVRYKDEIGALDPNNLPFGGVFLKDGNAVFWRVQIAPRMDSCGRGAVYCVVGAVPEDMAAKVDFRAVFASSEVSQPQKPFPTALDLPECTCEFKSPLGSKGFAERRFNGTETFSEIGGWCEEAKGGQLKIRITGTRDTPLFIVAYTPPPRRPTVEAVMPAATPPQRPAVQVESRTSCPNPFGDQSTRRPVDSGRAMSDGDGRRGKMSPDSFMNVLAAFAYGVAFGVIVTAVCAWLVWRENAKEPNVQGATPSSLEKSQGTPPTSSVETSESTNQENPAVESATHAGPSTPVDASPSGSANSNSGDEKCPAEAQRMREQQEDEGISDRKKETTGQGPAGKKKAAEGTPKSNLPGHSSAAKPANGTALMRPSEKPCDYIVVYVGVRVYGLNCMGYGGAHETVQWRRSFQW